MERNYQTITELNNYIKMIIDGDSFLNRVYIKGEISNFKLHTRGHLYFTLKDEYSRINAVMFAGSTSNLKFKPEDGMKVLITGRISTYPQSGSYQIYVDNMELDGLGNLYLEFEKLKKKLLQEGLFNKEHKKLIPKYPERIGVVTAPTGAAVRDIMSTIKRRFPICEVILFPSLVQGIEAKDDIVRQIKKADEFNLDLLIVGRGGGSIEDLWAFNEEGVARAIYECNTPVISAVGHEPDVTIADFVADLRAPTPTGAAEMAVPTVKDTLELINNYKARITKNIKNTVNTNFIKWRSLKNSFILKNPMTLYEIKEQKLDKLMDNATNSIKNIMINKTNCYKEIYNNTYNVLDKYLLNTKHKLDNLINTLKLVNPLNILDSGYSLVKQNDKIIKDIKDVKINDKIEIKLSKGLINANVIDIREDE